MYKIINVEMKCRNCGYVKEHINGKNEFKLICIKDELEPKIISDYKSGGCTWNIITRKAKGMM